MAAICFILLPYRTVIMQKRPNNRRLELNYKIGPKMNCKNRIVAISISTDDRFCAIKPF